MSYERTFNGEKYSYIGTATSKRDAKAEAEKQRSHGHKVRVVDNGTGRAWNIYIKYKKGW